MFRKWRTITSFREDHVIEFLEAISIYRFRVYAVRERPKYLRDDVTYSELKKKPHSCYFSAPQITIYILSTEKEWRKANRIWQCITFKMPNWAYNSAAQQVNAPIYGYTSMQNCISSTTSNITDIVQLYCNRIAQEQEVNRLRSRMLTAPICSIAQTQTALSTQMDQLHKDCTMSTRDAILYADDHAYEIDTGRQLY